MTTTHSHRNIRQHLCDLIEDSGISDRKLSRLATGNTYAVRNIRRGYIPRLDTIEAVCRILGYRLEIVPLDEPEQATNGAPAVESRPEWSRSLREEIRQDLVEILWRAEKGDSRSNGAE